MIRDLRALAVAHQTPGQCKYCDDRFEEIKQAAPLWASRRTGGAPGGARLQLPPDRGEP